MSGYQSSVLEQWPAAHLGYGRIFIGAVTACTAHLAVLV